jgi:excisionase family DNA binding protein
MIQLNCISTAEAASILGVSFPYLHNLIDTGKLRVVGTFGKRTFILDRHQVNDLKRKREEEKRRRPNDGRLK